MEHIASRKPISAPPFNDGIREASASVTKEQEYQETDPAQVRMDDRAGGYVEPPDYGQATSIISDARVPIREMMRVSNRFNYSQYYLLPARVGVRVLDQIMDEMFREGCKLTDIQVTFEVGEVR